MRKWRLVSGITVLELLIVFAVFGLMATLAIVSLNASRRAQRDAQRLSDISVLRASLTQYWLEKFNYPSSEGVDLGAPGTGADVLGGEGFVSLDQAKVPIYLNPVPVGPQAKEYYRYRGGPGGYSIRFETEGDTSLGKRNVFYAHASVIDGVDDQK